MTNSLLATFYVDESAYLKERAAVFGREWMILGRTAELTTAGGYIAEEIAGYPILVALDANGAPWGYHNVCPHRAGPILYPGRSHTDSLKCRYHGWCFSYEGALVEAPGFGEAPGFSLDDHRLTPISMGYWGGFIWVSLGGNQPPLTQALGRMVADCDDITFDALTHTEHVTKVFNCNWKLIVDNYLESYHVPHVHPILGKHFEIDDPLAQTVERASTLQRGRTRQGTEMRWFYRYPNITLQVLGNTLCWMQILPQGVDKTLLALDFYAPPGVDDTPLKSLCEQLLDEDQRICEHVQKNLAAGIFTTGQLSPREENAVAWFHDKILTSLDTRVELST